MEIKCKHHRLGIILLLLGIVLFIGHSAQATELFTKALAIKTQEPQTLLLDVTVNTEKLEEIIFVEQFADGRLVLPVEAWSRARLRPAGDLILLPDGNQGYALQAIPGLSYTLDNSMMALNITVPAEAFIARTIDGRQEKLIQPNLSQLGAYLNYNLTGTFSGENSISYGVLLEGIIFNRWGSLVASGLARGDSDKYELIRTDTYWQTDLPNTMETLVLGDTISTGAAWSSPVRYAGIRWARNFSLRPGYITYPMPSISGSSALPSTIDILVNNQRMQSDNIDSGPFEITNVPVVTGAGEINVVVRDLLGVESIVTQSYYSSPRLLTPGLADFSFEAGFLRKNYGSKSNDYGSAFVASTWRQGLTDNLTAEGSLELQLQRQAIGIEFTGLLGVFAVSRVAAAYSRNAHEQGGHYLIGLERSTADWGGGSIQWQYYDRHYTQLGVLNNENRPRDSLSAGYGIQIFKTLSVGTSYISQSNWNNEYFQLVSVNFGVPLPWDIYLSAYASKQLDRNAGWSGGLNLILPLSQQRSISAGSSLSTDGRLINALQASQSVSQAPGLGWRLRLSDDPNQQFQVGANFNTNLGSVGADANISENGNAFRLGAAGSVGWLEGLPFASRDIGHGSFAVVKVSDIEDVSVYRSNQLAATTNSSGLALVPNVLPYQDNQITIEPNELPFDIEIKGVRKVVVPYARSGMVVEFPVRRSRNALIVLRQPDGNPVPAGARIKISPSKQTFIVAKRGEVYLTDLKKHNRIAVQWPDGHCEITINLADDSPPEPRIGPLICGNP